MSEMTALYEVIVPLVPCSFLHDENRFGVCSCLKHYATSWKVVGLIPGEVIDFFFGLPNPSLAGIHSCTGNIRYEIFRT
jgi:hypothetical protein